MAEADPSFTNVEPEAVPAPAAKSPEPRKKWLRLTLMLSIPLLLLAGLGVYWLGLQGKVSTDNAYVKQDKVSVSAEVSGFATLAPQLRTEGSSLLNLGRSLGASVGIALMTVLLGHSIQTSHADLASHVTTSTGSLVDISTVGRFQAFGDIALRIADAEINRQAAMIAYINDFWLMMWLTIAAAPLAFLLRRNAQPGPKSSLDAAPH